MRTDHILVAVKPGRMAAEVVAAAASLAEPLGARVTLLTIVSIPAGINPFGTTDGMRNDKLLDKEAKRELKPFKADLKEDGIKTNRDIGRGDPAKAILAAIEKHDPGFVIMGTHGRKGLLRMFAGSVAETVARDSPVPVLIVRAPDDATDDEPDDETEEAPISVV